MLSFLYRLLMRIRQQDELTDDMLGAFEEARADARSQGPWRYFTFGLRELGGLLTVPGLPLGKLPLVVGMGLAGVVLGYAVGFVWPPSYTSVASLQVTPSVVPASLRPDLIDEDLASTVHAISNQFLSRYVLTTIIRDLGLYPNARKSEPLEDVIEEMREGIRIQSQDESVFDIAFTYHDRWSYSDQTGHDAQRVVQNLVTRFIDETIRRRVNSTFQTRDFLEDQTTDAGQKWEEMSAALSKLNPSDPSYDRVALDVELARDQYVTYSKRLSDARVLEELEGRVQGAQLQVVDAASLPGEPDLSPRDTAAMGLAAGLIAGALLVLWRAIAAVWPARLHSEPSTQA